MIKYIQIENFKSLRKIGLSLENLNLFFGRNGMGKSSVIQMLLLLRQSYWENRKKDMDILYTNGELIRLGTGKDVFCQNTDEDYMRFYLRFSDKKTYDFRYKYKYSEDMDNDQLVGTDISDDSYDEALFSNEFVYLSAEHLGPRKQYSTENWKRDGAAKYGNMGEYIVPFLAAEGESFKVPDELCSENGKTNKLIDQVSAWMTDISPGIKLSAEFISTLEKAKLSIRYSGDRLDTEPFSPVNVGFGIPYVLPLIVELLTSDKNGLVLMENPESHLHPKGQAVIAKLIAMVAARGTQVICESHSDHIINGIRVAVKKQIIDCDKLTVSYFDKNKDQNTLVENIMVDSNGNLDNYPEGLLDEWGILMAELL